MGMVVLSWGWGWRGAVVIVVVFFFSLLADLVSRLALSVGWGKGTEGLFGRCWWLTAAAADNVLVLAGGALKDVWIVPPLCELPAVPLPHETLPTPTQLGLVERANVDLLLQVEIVGKEGLEGGQVAARELAGIEGQLLVGGCRLC
jgi:hypothetical protein